MLPRFELSVGEVLVRRLPLVVLLDARRQQEATPAVVDVRQVHVVVGLRSPVDQTWVLVGVRTRDVGGALHLLPVTALEKLLLLLNGLHLLQLLHLLKH